MDPYFYLSITLLSAYLLFSVKIQTKQGQIVLLEVAICQKKHKVTLSTV